MEPVYTVLNPSGLYNDIPLAPLASRYSDYTGKTIYFVYSWAQQHGFEVVSEELKRYLKEKYNGVHIVERSRQAYASDEPPLWEEMRRECDAFVYFAAPSCSTTAYAVTWPARALERTGVPGCVVLYSYLEEDAIMSQEREGMKIRYIKTPYPCVNIETKELERLLEQIRTALTAEPQGEELQSGMYTPPMPERIALTGTFDEVQDYFIAHQWSDGLPIVPPTEERVAAMLKGTSHAPDEVVCTQMAPEGQKVTVEKAAIVAVMAGAKPEYFPVILTMVEIMGRTQRYHATSKSTNSFSYMQVVNGSIRKEIGMNDTIYALGAGNRPNAVIGRAQRLALNCLGGARVGVNLMGVQGNVSSYTFAFAENEEDCPWEPLSVRQGYSQGESVLTIFTGGFSHNGNFMLEERMQNVFDSVKTFDFCSGFTLLIAPRRAGELTERENFKSGADCERYLWRGTHFPKGELIENYHWGRYIARELKNRSGVFPQEYEDAPLDTKCAMFRQDEIKVVCVGDPKGTNCMQVWNMYHADSASIDYWR